MSASQRRKGNRVECEIVNAHKEIGVHAERYPLSGASHFRGQGYDLDIYAFGREEAPAVAEVKARKDGEGFALLERWLGEYDLLFLKRDRQDPLVVLPWRMYERLIKRQERSLTHGKTDGKTESRRAAQSPQGSPT
jgi:Holliday junction resolvase